MYLFDASDSVPEVRGGGGGGGNINLNAEYFLLYYPLKTLPTNLLLTLTYLNYFTLNFLYQITTQSSRTEVTESLHHRILKDK